MNELYLLNTDDFVAMHDLTDLLAIAGIGGYNSPHRDLNRPRIEAHLLRAQSFVESYLNDRYSDIPALASSEYGHHLKGIASDLTIYWLRDRSGDRGAVDDVVRKRYEDAVNWLKDVAKGTVELNLSTGRSTLVDNATNNNIHGSFPTSRTSSIMEGYQ